MGRSRKTTLGTCVHCGRSGVRMTARKLCSRCYHNPSIKALYPAREREPEPTEEELEATIAEQMKNLPPWWNEPEPEDDA